MLGIIDGACRSFEDRILNTNDDLRDERFEEVPGDYADFYERDSPIQNAYEGLIPMANTTLNFLEESTLAAIGEMVLFQFSAQNCHKWSGFMNWIISHFAEFKAQREALFISGSRTLLARGYTFV